MRSVVMGLAYLAMVAAAALSALPALSVACALSAAAVPPIPLSSASAPSAERSQDLAASAAPAVEPEFSAADMGRNLLLNGDLRQGSDDAPDHWRSEAWEQKPGTTTFRWLHSSSKLGELSVTNHKPNDARWTQSLTLPAGWFYLSALIRAQNVPRSGRGASLSILEGAIGSVDLHGTTEFEQRGFYLKVGPRGADVEVACRLGGFGSLNTGTAICTDLKAVAIEAPPPGAGPTFDLDEVRRQYTTPPVGSPWTLAAAFAFTLALALFGWTMLGKTWPANHRAGDADP
jgi:hypothetical protein